MATIDEVLAAARARIARLDPQQTWTAMAGGALLLDLRDHDRRARDGVVPGSIHVPTLVLEWRVCVESGFANPVVRGREQPLVLLCNEGYGSSLAAARLVDLGFTDVADVIGGFAAWRDSGLPTAPPQPSREGALDGLGDPEPGGPAA